MDQPDQPDPTPTFKPYAHFEEGQKYNITKF